MNDNGSAAEHDGNGTPPEPSGNGAAHREHVPPVQSTELITQTPVFEPPPDESANLLRPQAILAALRRRWFLALTLGVLLGGGAAATVWYFVPTPYTAFAQLQIQSTRFFWRTSEDDAYSGGGGRQLDDYKREMMGRVTDPFVINAALRDPEVSDCRTLREVEYKDLWLQDQLSVSSSGQRFIRISLSGEHPHDLANIVNAVVRAFEKEVIEAQQQDRRKNLDELRQVAFDANARLEDLKNQLEQLNRQIRVTNTEQSTLAMQLKQDLQVQLRAEYGEIRLQIIQKEVQLGALQGNSIEEQVADIQIPDAVLDAQLMEDSEYRRLYQSVMQQETLVAEYQSRVREDNSSRMEAEAVLSELEEHLQTYRAQQLPVIRERLLQGGVAGASTVDILENELRQLRVYEQQYKEQLEEIKLESQNLAINLVEREVLAEEYADLKAKVTTYEDEIFRREVELEKGADPIQVYFEADVPRLPDQAKRIKMASVAGLGLFGLVAGLIVFLELRSRRIDSANEVEDGLHLQLIGSIPVVPRSVNGAANGSSNRRTSYWQSLLTESIDSARTILLQRAKTDGLKTIMITSATGSEGKTTLSCHLATSLVRASRRVLLVDCDVRRPSVHRVFDLEKSPGFCEVICGEATLEESIQPAHPEGLFVLSAGDVNEETLRRMVLDDLSDLLTEAGRHFDLIIVDSAPVLPVVDTMLLAPHMDAIMFSIRRDVSRVANIAAAVQRLDRLGAPIIGAVAIGLDASGPESRYSRYYGYGYRHTRTHQYPRAS